MGWFKRLICRWFGHRIVFVPEPPGYAPECVRCGAYRPTGLYRDG